MPGNTLNGEALHSYDLAWIPFFILVREKIAAFFFVIAGIAFQRILSVSVECNDYIPYISRAIALDDQQIILLDISSCTKKLSRSARSRSAEDWTQP